MQVRAEFAHGPLPNRIVQLGQDRSGRDPKRQCQASETGNRPFVDAPKLVGPIDRADPCRHPGHQRSRQHAAGHRHGEDHQVSVRDHHRPDRLPETPSVLSRIGPQKLGLGWRAAAGGAALSARPSTDERISHPGGAREDCVLRELTNRMRQSTVDLVFHDSCGCVPIPRFRLRRGGQIVAVSPAVRGAPTRSTRSWTISARAVRALPNSGLTFKISSSISAISQFVTTRVSIWEPWNSLRTWRRSANFLARGDSSHTKTIKMDSTPANYSAVLPFGGCGNRRDILGTLRGR